MLAFFDMLIKSYGKFVRDPHNYLTKNAATRYLSVGWHELHLLSRNIVGVQMRQAIAMLLRTMVSER